MLSEQEWRKVSDWMAKFGLLKRCGQVLAGRWKRRLKKDWEKAWNESWIAA
jgi:hypothetical protein